MIGDEMDEKPRPLALRQGDSQCETPQPAEAERRTLQDPAGRDFAFVTARRRRRICARYIALRTIVALADDFIGGFPRRGHVSNLAQAGRSCCSTAISNATASAYMS